MSEVDVQEEFHDAPEEATAEVQSEVVAEIEQENAEPQQEDEALVTAEADDEKSAQPLDEDRTEDQVPDITGTEYVDPMTTSMDGIEDLPANEEAQFEDIIVEEDEIPDQLESTDHQEPRSDALSSEYIEEEIIEEEEIEESEYAEESAPAADENAQAEETPAAEEAAPAEEVRMMREPIKCDTPAENAEEEAPADAPAETPVEEAAAEADAPPAEENAEPEAELIEVAVEEAPAEETPAEGTEEPATEKQEFELQAPPEGKRPRTPNELDNPPAENEVVVEEAQAESEVPATPRTATSEKRSVPPTPRSAVPSEVPATPKSAAPSEVPATPKSAAPSEVPQTPKSAAPSEVPTTPKSAAPSEVPPTPKSAAPSEVPPTPKSAAPSEVPPTPKSAAPSEVPPTPKSAAPSEVPPTPKSAAPSEVPPTPKSAAPSEVPPTPKSAAPSEVPPTPKSAAPSEVPPTPRSAAPSDVPPTPKLTNGSIPGTPSVALSSAKATPAATPAAEATPAATATPKGNTAFTFEETPATPRSSVPATPIDSLTPAAKTPKTPKTPRTPRTPRTPKAPKTPTVVEAEEPAPEPAAEPVEESEPVAEEQVQEPEPAEEPEPVAEEEPVAESEPAAEPEPVVQEEPEEQIEEPIAKTEVSQDEAAPARRASPSPPPRRRVESPSPERKRTSRHADRDIATFDEDSYRTVPPPRIPTATSFSSWSPPDKQSYTPISPFVSTANKYRSDYTAGTYRPTNVYTSHFDDIVNTGAFSCALYSTTRLIERSRSRTRERKQALRSQRSASNYYRYVSQYPAPTRAREYSTPPTHAISRPPSRNSSFVSFLDYSESKQGELSRANSRSSIYGDALSRSGSRSNVDLYLGGGRLSRVDSYVRDIHTPYEYEVPSTYDRYRSSSRGPSYSTVNGYTAYTSSPSYVETDSTRRMKRYQRDTSPAMVRSLYEGRIGHLERSLSREVIQKDRLRNEYQQLSSKLDQAVRQMELLSPYTPPAMDAQRLTNRPDIRRSIAYTLDLRATGLPTTERWRLGNVVYGGLYRKKYDADIEKSVQYYSSCAKKRR